MRRIGPVLVMAACLMVAGCGSDDESGDATTEESSMGESSTPSEETPEQPQVVKDAVTDLAARLGVDAGDVTVVGVEDVTWRDGSIGCAEPGKMYTQALVEGKRVRLSVGGEEHEYHSGGARDLFLCAEPTE